MGRLQGGEIKMIYNKGMTTNDLFLRAFYRHPKKMALIDGKYKYSYTELNKESNRLANAIQSLGVKKGDKVALLAKNCKEFVFIYLGLSKIGVVMVPLNYRCVAKELEYMLNDCGASLLVFEAEYAQTITQLKEFVPQLSKYISIGECDLPFVTTFDAFISKSSPTEPNVNVLEDDECAILYTSGTTGKPKGAVITHRTRVSCTVNILMDGSVEEGGTSLQGGPLFHAGAQNIGLLPYLSAGGAIALIPFLSPEQISKAIETEKVTHIVTVPTILHNMLEEGSFDKFNFTSLRKIYYGGSAISLTDLERILKRLPKVEFFQGYGQTESAQLTVLKPEYHATKFGRTGRPHLLVDLRVVDKNDQDVLPGNAGEVVTRGPHLMKGYLNLPKANEGAFRNGWFHTGDVAQIDEDRFITIAGRKTEMIISGGENIYPREIEIVLSANPKISEVVVFGIPDEKWGESVCAGVILKEGESLTEEEVIKYCKENLASYKKPRKVVFCSSFPKNPLGKVQKEELKKQVLEGIRRKD
jgi:acyl-CoA synthetase (AMP-forming)/AMP-acid ligase II